MLEEVIKNADEALRACMPYVRWVTDALASQITDFNGELNAPPENIMAFAIRESIREVMEVPFGWFVFPNKGGSVMVNRWTGQVFPDGDFSNGGYVPSLAADVRWYIENRLPTAQRNACLSSPYNEKWDDNDPVRFDPPLLEIDEALGIHQTIHLNLEIDPSHLVYFGGKTPQLFSCNPFPELMNRPFGHRYKDVIQKCEWVRTYFAGDTHIYNYQLHLDLSVQKCYGGLNHDLFEKITIARDPAWDQYTIDLFNDYWVVLKRKKKRKGNGTGLSKLPA